MTYEQFVETVINVYNKTELRGEHIDFLDYDYSNNFSIPTHIKIEYESRGATGGSCWGGEASYYENTDVDAEFVVLDELLEIICPKISYLEYRKLTKLIKTTSREQYEHYGNWTEYKSKNLDLKSLYQFLKDTNNV